MARLARRPHLHAGPRARKAAFPPSLPLAGPPARLPGSRRRFPERRGREGAEAALADRASRPRLSPREKSAPPLSAPGRRPLPARAIYSRVPPAPPRPRWRRGAGPERRAGAGQAWRERLEPIQRAAAARRATRWPAARPRPRPLGHLQVGVSPGGGGWQSGVGGWEGALDST